MYQNSFGCFSILIKIAITFLTSNIQSSNEVLAKAEVADNNNGGSDMIKLGETLQKLDSIIDNLAEFYGHPDSDTGLQSRYLIPTDDDPLSSMRKVQR